MNTPDLSRDLYLVKGYQKNIYPPNDAYAANLRYRFAVVLNTNYPTIDGSHFEVEYYFDLLDTCLSEIGYEKLLVNLDNNNEYASTKIVKENILNMPEEDREPPLRIWLYSNDEKFGLIETEFWVKCGGPFPYHDSYTLAIYTQKDVSDKIVENCTRVASKWGGKIIDVIEGKKTPLPRQPWWKKLFWRVK